MRSYAILFLSILLFASCTKDKAIDPGTIVGNCDSTSITYNKHIKQILENNCALSGCHDAATKQSGFNFSNYTDSKQIYRALDNINDRNGAILMPTFGKMPDSLITQIETWVANGYCE